MKIVIVNFANLDTFFIEEGLTSTLMENENDESYRVACSYKLAPKKTVRRLKNAKEMMIKEVEKMKTEIEKIDKVIGE